MSRVTLGLLTASLFGIAAASPALASCCGWGSGCCASAYQPAQVYVQPAPVYVQPAPPMIVQAPPQQVIVQIPQPEIVFQHQQQTVPHYTVNQGPVYSGIEQYGYSRPVYYADQPVRAYPYVPGYYRPYRSSRPYGYKRQGYHAWKHRHHRVYKSHKYSDDRGSRKRWH